MLNRETIAEDTNIRRRSHKLGSHQYYHHHHHYHKQQLIEVCSPSLLITGSKKGSNSIVSFIGDNNTDAILSESRNSQLVSQRQQKSSIATSFIESLNAIRPTHSLNKITVPNSSENHQVKCNSRTVTRQRFSNPNNLTTELHQQQQPVNPKAIIDRNCCYNRSSPKVNTYKNIMINMRMNPIYYLSALLFALCALSTTAQFAIADGSLQTNLQKLKISPDIISVPSDVNIIKVELYGNAVKPGDPVPAKNFKDLNMAKIQWDVSNFDARHTLLLLDLDRKHSGNGTNSIYNQFTSLNIPGNIINAGQTIVAFDTPIVPCQPSSKHRILMLAFHQKQNIDITDVAYMSASSGQTSKRENFKLNEFINRHRLDLVAANVFLAIGETNGVCSASVTLHSLQSVSPSILIAMVTAIMALVSTSFSRSLVN